MADKSNDIKKQLPSAFADRKPSAPTAMHRMLEAIRPIYERAKAWLLRSHRPAPASDKSRKSGKPDKLKARLPRGLADRGPAEIAATRHMIDAIRAVYERYGFDPVETPAIEYTDALGKFLPDQDRPNEGVFSFQDDDEQWLSLRYDLTANTPSFGRSD